MKRAFPLLIFWSATLFSVTAPVATLQDLNSFIQQSQWDDAVQTAHEILIKDPRNSEAKLKGAYALFQKGYPNAALVLLKKLSSQEWKNLPQGQDRFVEIVSFFQKKVPLNHLP